MLSLLDTDKRTCDKCGTADGEVFHFHYGKELSKTRDLHIDGMVLTTKYGVAGTQSAAVCDTCIVRHRITMAIQWALITAASVGFAIWAYRPPEGWGLLGLLAFLAALLGIAFMAKLIESLFSRRDTHGEEVAIAVKKGELREQGFDVFWSTTEFLKLR